MDKIRMEIPSQLWQDLPNNDCLAVRKVFGFAVAADIAFRMQATHTGA